MAYRTAWCFILLLLVAAAPVNAETTAAKIVREGRMKCGVSETLLGFAHQDEKGAWKGLSVDFCRAVAAAVLGDGEAVKFFPLSASARLPALLSGQIDLLSHTTPVSFAREAAIGVVFPGIYFLDGSQFLVAKSAGAKKIEDLNAATICIEKNTAGATVAANTFQQRGLKYTPLQLDSLSDVIHALFSGRCQAMVAVRAKLLAALSSASEKAAQFEILPEYLSKQTLGPTVRHGDEKWATLVRWVLYALIEAEERGISRDKVSQLAVSGDPGTKQFLLDSGKLGITLGLRPDWIVKVIAAVGNYGEIYERNFGQGSNLKMDRAYNRLWKDGGLLYSPPFQ